MTKEVDKAIIVLSPVGSVDLVVPGSVHYIADCGHACWIGQVSLAAAKNPFMATETVCNRCVDLDVLRKSVMDHKGFSALPGAHAELAAALGQEAADETYRVLHVKEVQPRENRS